MNIGKIVVKPTDPIGTILQRNTFTISPNNSTATCSRASDQIIAALPLNYPISPIGNNVYATNIPVLVFVFIVKQQMLQIFLDIIHIDVL